MLTECTGDELEALCRLLGIPYSGTKVVKINRLLDMADLRVTLSTWGEWHCDDFHEAQKKARELAEEIVTRYKRSELVAMARRAKIFYGVPKFGIVVALLQWRDECRMKGYLFNDEIKNATKVQYVLPGFA